MFNSNKDFFDKIMQASRRTFIYVGIFSLAINLLMLTVPLYMLQVFDRVLPSHSTDTLLYLTLIAMIALIVFGLLLFTRSLILIRLGHWYDELLGPKALSLAPDSILYGSNYGGQAMRDIGVTRQFLTSEAVFAFFDAPWIPIYLAVIFLLHPVLGFVALASAIVLFITALLNEILTRKPLREANADSINANNFVESTLRNAEVIQAMGMIEGLTNKWQKINKKVLEKQSQASDRSSILTSFSKFCRLSFQMFMLGAGAYLVVLNELSAGGMIAGTILLSRALAPIEQSIGGWKAFVGARQAFSRLKGYFQNMQRETTEITLPNPKGHVHLETVTFGFPNTGKAIVSQINLEIHAGECLGIIGPSGAGKTTLLRLIVGALKPVMGNVRLDGAEVYSWSRDQFGEHIGYLPQDIELFPGTIKENIARFKEFEDEDVISAAKASGVHELILQLAEGYDTEIHTSNFKLSGGQRQRIGLARALYKNPALVILDEPNSNLDQDGERALFKAIADIRQQGRTLIVIAHSAPVLQHVENLVFLGDDGQIKLHGPRDLVLQRLQEVAKKQSEAVKTQKVAGN